MRYGNAIRSLGATVVVLFAGCDVALEDAPTITQIDTPQVTAVSIFLPGPSTLGTVTSRARIDTKGWAYAAPYFTFAPTSVSLQSPQAARRYPICTPEQSSPTILRCEINIARPPGEYHFKWGLDYGLSGADTLTIERPNPAGTFRITNFAENDGNFDQMSPSTSPPPPATPAVLGPLVLIDPPDGATCVGTYLSPFNVQSLQLAWRAQNTAAFTAMPGDYQIVLEHLQPPNCDTAPGLNLSAPDAAFGYDPSNGCYVVAENMNVTATPPLEPEREYRWRVRRILQNGQFEGFTDWSSFTTSGPGC